MAKLRAKENESARGRSRVFREKPRQVKVEHSGHNRQQSGCGKKEKTMDHLVNWIRGCLSEIFPGQTMTPGIC